VRFNPKARIDTSRTRDTGRSGGGGGFGRSGGASLPLPGGAGGGIGIGGVLLVVLFLVLTQCVGGSDTAIDSGAGPGTGQAGSTDRFASCETGADANQDADCITPIVENSLVAFWSRTLPEQTGTAFTPTSVTTFTDAVSTGGCGQASSAVGPFYCPVDQAIYLDTSFFEQVLEGQLGGSGGDFVEPYVLAHEYGHHVQNLLGTMAQVRTQQGPESDAVRLELQADCYAGMWTRGALETTDDSGVRIFESLDQADIDEALDAARTVGDDLIQRQSGGRVDPEGWTHGSSEQRQAWFTTGYDAGSIDECDTFSASSL
jgi:predicted metalloprotease